MLWLSILTNEILLLVAETMVIVIGSMLMGIWLSYLYSGGTKQKVVDLSAALEAERKQAEELREQVRQISQLRAQLQSELGFQKEKADSQARTSYDQQQYITAKEEEYRTQKSTIDQLNATIDAYQHRLTIIQDELQQARGPVTKSKITVPIPAIRANYEHVSKLLGRQVTENDLTLITGIGPKTADLLKSHGIQTWEDLAGTKLEILKEWLSVAGGIYKSQDPTHWAKQALMASQGEWRKLRVLQETLRKIS